MALVSGGRSNLNPNAPLFVPAAVRQVEDFSPEWWQLVTTSTWFHGYWLSQQQGDDDFYGDHEDDFADIVDLLPDSIDLGTEEDFMTMEAQFEKFIHSSEVVHGNKSSLSAPNGIPEIDNDQMVLTKVPSSSDSYRERAHMSQMGLDKNWEKPAKSLISQNSNRRIQQPR